jgi:hypothetical protein
MRSSSPNYPAAAPRSEEAEDSANERSFSSAARRPMAFAAYLTTFPNLTMWS